MENNNYLHVVPGSQFFTSIDQIIAFIEQDVQSPYTHTSIYDLITGLKNTKKNGYMLVKLENDNER